MSVKPELVKEMLVDRIAGGVEERALPDDGLERRGYLARGVETELFEPARAPMPWLAELVAGRDAAEVAVELAAADPAGRPDPPEGTWRVPGPGGHVRYFVFLEAFARLGLSGEREPHEREWLRGFYRRCCEEVATR